MSTFYQSASGFYDQGSEHLYGYNGWGISQEPASKELFEAPEIKTPFSQNLNETTSREPVAREFFSVPETETAFQPLEGPVLVAQSNQNQSKVLSFHNQKFLELYTLRKEKYGNNFLLNGLRWVAGRGNETDLIDKALSNYEKQINLFASKANPTQKDISNLTRSFQVVNNALTQGLIREDRNVARINQGGAEIVNIVGKVSDEGIRYAVTAKTLPAAGGNLRSAMLAGNIAAALNREGRAQLSNGVANFLNNDGSLKTQLQTYNGTFGDRLTQTGTEMAIGAIAPTLNNPMGRAAASGAISGYSDLWSQALQPVPKDIDLKSIGLSTLSGSVGSYGGTKLSELIENPIIAGAAGNAFDFLMGTGEGVAQGATLQEAFKQTARQSVGNIAGQTAFSRTYQKQAQRVEEAYKRFDQSYDQLTQNPVTPSVKNEQFLDKTLLREQQQGRETALMLFDGNLFSSYNVNVGTDLGDVAIDRLSNVAAKAALRLNQLYYEEGLMFYPIRKSGDEFAILVVYADSNSVQSKMPIPQSVAQDMVRIYNDEVAVYNKDHSLPMPTSSSSVQIFKTGLFDNKTGMTALTDALDHKGVALFNGENPQLWRRNAGAIIDSEGAVQQYPGPVYEFNAQSELPDFRRIQGGVENIGDMYKDISPTGTLLTNFYGDLYSRQRINYNLVGASDPSFARPQLLPDAKPSRIDSDIKYGNAEKLFADSSSDLVSRDKVNLFSPRAVQEALDQANSLTRLNEEYAPIESTMRHLKRSDGLNVYNLQAGTEKINTLLDLARQSPDGGEVTLVAFEPRGLKWHNAPDATPHAERRAEDATFKDINDNGYILYKGEKFATGHTGGNLVIEKMVLASHQAAIDVFGKDYQDQGLMVMTRHRGKRFVAGFSHTVTKEQVALFNQAALDHYRFMEPKVIGPDGNKYALRVEDRYEGHDFVFDSAFAAVRLNPKDDMHANLTAKTMLDKIVAPLDGGSESLMDIAKLVADGERRIDLSLLQSDGIEYMITGPRYYNSYASDNKRGFDTSEPSLMLPRGKDNIWHDRAGVTIHNLANDALDPD